jgi:predicted lipid-binding transport protein (Tim44 family)
VSIRYQAELTRVVRDASGAVVEGNPTEIRRQRDIWTFARTMGASDPNWQLVATGD